MSDVPLIGLALQGGGAHGAFTWGVLDRLLVEVEAGRLRIGAISGTSAGALNAAACGLGLRDGPARARERLRQLWRRASDEALMVNPLVVSSALLRIQDGKRWNIDGQPFVAVLDAFSQTLSPYDWVGLLPNALQSVLQATLPDLARLNEVGSDPAIFVCATGVSDNTRQVFAAPDITVNTLLASACEPLSFPAVEIGGEFYWDGGFIGNPAIEPLFKTADCDDVVVVQINPLNRRGPPPRTHRDIADRVNEVSFNASLVLEVNAIHTVNALVDEIEALRQQMEAAGITPERPRNAYRPIRLHAIANEPFMQGLGLASKNNPYWPFMEDLFGKGSAAAETWLAAHRGDLGQRTSWDIGGKIKPKLALPS